MDVREVFVGNLARAQRHAEPYPHWVLPEVFSAEIAEALDGLEFAVGDELDYGGRRECNNSIRNFFTPDRQEVNPTIRAVTGALSHPDTVSVIEDTFGLDLSGTSLRVEYCQDVDGFWLEPHTDIGVKRFTMLCYLSAGAGSDPCGTDVMDAQGQVLKRAPFHRNAGFAFVPAPDTWHGFTPRRINGVRKSVMVNYVGPEWRARHELAGARPVK